MGEQPSTDVPTEQIPVVRTQRVTPPLAPRRHERAWLWISLASIAGLLIVGSVVAVATSGPSDNPASTPLAASSSPRPTPAPDDRPVTVPALVGLSGNAASAALGVAGVLDVRFTVNYAPMSNPVMSQSPMPGTRQRAGDPVFVTLQPASPTTQPAAAPAPPESAAAERFDDGMYEVGSDVAPGRYKTTGEGSIGFCAWASYPDSSRDYTKTIDGATSTGQMYLTVKDGEFLEVAGGCTWTKRG